MTRYEKIATFIASLALVISVLVAGKDFAYRTLGSTRASISMERELFIGSRIGYLQLSPYTQIANEGSRDIRLGHAEIDFTFESGKRLKLIADSFQPISQDSYAQIKLSDRVIEPDKLFSGRLVFFEELKRSQEDALRMLEHSAQVSAYDDYQTTLVAQQKLFAKLADAVIGGGKPQDFQRGVSFLPALAWKQYGEAKSELLARARDEFSTRISRVEKGEHKLVLTIYDFGGKIIVVRNFQVTIFESQISELNGLFDGFGRWYGSNVYVPKPVLAPKLKLKDERSQN